MAHLNYFLLGLQVSTSVSSLLSRLVVGVGIMQNSKWCLRKIDCEMNMQNCGYSAKLRNGDECYMADGNSSCQELAPSFFEQMTCCRCQKHRQRWPGNPNVQSKFRKYRVYLPILHIISEITTDALQLTVLKWHVADIKNITSDDQLTLKIDWSSAITKI